MELENLQNKLGDDNVIKVLDKILLNTLRKAVEHELDGEFKDALELYAKADKTGHTLANEAYRGFKIRAMVREAEKNGKNPDVQYSVGLRHETGMDGPVNKDKALEWYRKAAEQKYPKAMLKMGDFARDNGDLEQAHKWYIDTIKCVTNVDPHYSKAVEKLMITLQAQQCPTNTEEEVKQSTPLQTQSYTQTQSQLPLSNSPMYVYEFYNHKGLKLYEIAASRVFSIEIKYGDKREKGNKTYYIELTKSDAWNNYKTINAFSHTLKAY